MSDNTSRTLFYIAEQISLMVTRAATMAHYTEESNQYLADARWLEALKRRLPKDTSDKKLNPLKAAKKAVQAKAAAKAAEKGKK